MGLRIAQALLDREYEIVAAISHQVGADLGTVLGAPPNGVTIVERPEEVDADAETCVIATHSLLSQLAPQIEWALGRGMHVVSCGEEMVVPAASSATAAAQIDAAAKRAGRAVTGTGVNPGFSMDVLPICLTAACITVERINVRRVNDLSPFGTSVLRSFGVGLDTAEHARARELGEIVGHVGFRESAALISEATGLRWDSFEERAEPIVATSRRQHGDTVVDAGRVAGIRQQAFARRDGSTVLEFDHPQQLQPAADGVETGDFIEILGDPPIRARIEPEIDGGGATAALVANVIPKLLRASPGLHTAATLPLPSLSFGRR
ncbi:MAG: hypothetical protein JSS68_12755 [Actinobacteria bacterium]|nr:hypothetical protein [Actinomycetota bacterium]